jgi:signal recognition particle subunit SRP9
MYIENWDSFYVQAVDLYHNSPLKTRFTTKYRHCDGKLILKVTDDATVGFSRRRCRRPSRLHDSTMVYFYGAVQCLQYKTDQQADLKKIEKLSKVFFSLMATGEPPAGATVLPA